MEAINGQKPRSCQNVSYLLSERWGGYAPIARVRSPDSTNPILEQFDPIVCRLSHTCSIREQSIDLASLSPSGHVPAGVSGYAKEKYDLPEDENPSHPEFVAPDAQLLWKHNCSSCQQDVQTPEFSNSPAPHALRRAQNRAFQSCLEVWEAPDDERTAKS